MGAKVISLDKYKKEIQDNVCIDIVVGDWIEALHSKIEEIYDTLGFEAACQFHHRVCGTNLTHSKAVVNIIIDFEEE